MSEIFNNSQNHFRTDFDYDANGNITNLQRNMDNTLIDDLDYTYYSNSNRLQSVTDASGNTAGYVPNTGQYLYDANGNMTYDPSKKINVSYNPLNLPRLVEFDNDDHITYTYTANGTKLRKTVTSWKTTTGGTTDYSGQFLYQDNELSCIFTPVGRIVPMQYNDETFWKHEYNLKDHLGNTRVVFAAHPHGQPEVMQQTSYYPFGMTLQQQNFGSAHNPPNKLLYNGKELQDDELAGVSLDWYDYGARMYDAQIGRWHVVDPMAENYYSWSSYNYTMNNPISFIDPNGMYVDNYEIYSNGNIVKYETDDKSNTYTYVDEDGARHEVGTYDKNDKGLIQLGNIDDSDGSGAKISVKPGNSDRMYASGDAVASLIGASADSGEEIYVISISNSDGSSPSPSVSHKDGKNLDTRYAGKNGSRDAINYKDSKTNFDKIDQTASASMNAGMKKFGWKDIRSSTLTISNTKTVGGKEVSTSTNYSVSGTTHLKNHYNHQHIQGYRPNVVNRTAALKPLPMIPFRGF
ncbi:MAG: RHS repeat-associated core domain-containing protein [Bacteroidales bacterium]|nr:RHS repeat-associated core domain-containing protein [Bacteroidales bacterium]